MNKRIVEENMGKAAEAIEKVFALQEQEEKVIDKTYRSKMSAFGAAVMMSGILPAIAYYQKNEVKIIELLKCMIPTVEGSLFDYIKNQEDRNAITETILNYSISLKLAMNLYIVEKDDNK